MEGFKIQIPQSACVWRQYGKTPLDINTRFKVPDKGANWIGYNEQCPAGLRHNIEYSPMQQLTEYRANPERIHDYQVVKQTLENNNQTKITTIIPNKYTKTRNEFGIVDFIPRREKVGYYEMGQHRAPDGTYTCRIVGNGHVIEKTMKPEERKLLTGFKGGIEKAALSVAQKSNGCERPILRRISGCVINLLRHVR